MEVVETHKRKEGIDYYMKNTTDLVEFGTTEGFLDAPYKLNLSDIFIMTLFCGRC